MEEIAGKKFGFARVSKLEQNLDLQIDALKKAGVDEKDIFVEKISGASKSRPQLEEMLRFLRPGDQVIVYKLDRISRSTKHLIELSEEFERMGVDFISLSEKIDTTTSYGKLFFRLMASLAEFERDIIIERTQAGLEAARARGRVGGRPKADQERVDYAYHLYLQKKYTIPEIVAKTKVSKSTLYRHIEEQRAKEAQNGQEIG